MHAYGIEPQSAAATCGGLGTRLGRFPHATGYAAAIPATVINTVRRRPADRLDHRTGRGQSMPISEARVQTLKADRYLAQLCRHADAISRRPGRHLHDSPAPAHPDLRIRQVERSGTTATLEFDLGRCTLDTEPDALTLRAEADDAASLRRLEDLIAADIERFGNREQVTVAWRRHHDNNGDGHSESHEIAPTAR